MSVDRFGNVQLSIPAADAGMLGIGVGTPLIVRCGRRQLTVPLPTPSRPWPRARSSPSPTARG